MQGFTCIIKWRRIIGRSYTATKGKEQDVNNSTGDEQVPYHNICSDEALVNTTAPRPMFEPQSRVVLTASVQRNRMATRRTLDVLWVKRLRDSPWVLFE